MGRFDATKSIIDQNITTNGQQEITGATLNSTLDSMLDAVDSAMTTDKSELSQRIGTNQTNIQTINTNLNNLGDWVEEIDGEVDDLKSNIGIADYPLFSASTAYVTGDLVRYEGRLYEFTSDHAAGAWLGTDVSETSIKEQTDNKLTELESGNEKYVGIQEISFDGAKVSIVGFVVRNQSVVSINGEYEFTENSILVLHSDNTTEFIVGGVNVKDDDIALLYYSVTDGYLGGVLFPYYLQCVQQEKFGDIAKLRGMLGATSNGFIAKVLRYDDVGVGGNIRYHLRLFLPVDSPCEVSFSSETYYASYIGIVSSIENGLLPIPVFVEQINNQATHSFSGATSESGYLLLSVRTEDSTVPLTDEIVSNILSEINLSALADSLLESKIETKLTELESEVTELESEVTELEQGNEKYVGIQDIYFDGAKVSITGFVNRNQEIVRIDGEYEFTENSILVLHSDNTIEFIVGGANVKDDDIALLYYSVTQGYLGGVLYPYYIKQKVNNLEQGNEKYVGVQEISFDGAKVNITGFVNRNQEIVYITGEYEFTENSILVLHSDNTTEFIVGGANVKNDDIALLYYSVTQGYLGGVLYPYYLQYIQSLKNELISTMTNESLAKKHNITTEDITTYNSDFRGCIHLENKSLISLKLTLDESSPYMVYVGGYTNGQSILVNDYSHNIDVSIAANSYDFVYLLIRNGAENNLVNIDDFMSAILSQDITYFESSFDIENNCQYKTGNIIKSGNDAISEYLAVTIQNGKIKFMLPSYLQVRLQYGSREQIGETSNFVNGQTLQMTDEMVAVRILFSSIDGRGVSAEWLNQNVGKLWAIVIEQEKYDILNSQNDCEKYALSLLATPTFTIENQVRLPMICHTSDIHGDIERFESMNKFAKYIHSDLLVNTGDTCLFAMNDGVKFCEDIVKKYGVDYAVCVGNHDTYYSDDISYTGCVEPFVESNNYLLSEGNLTDKAYYYKDMESQKLRIISLDIYDGINTANYKARISSEQMNWFIATLSSTPQGYGVIVILHQTPNSLVAISGKENFNSSNMPVGQLNIASDYMSLGKITGNPLGKIIDAFIGRTNVSGTYFNTFTNEEISYTADFNSVASGVEFLMYLNGHVHKDYVGYVADCEHHQLNINVAACIAIKSKYQTIFSGDYDCARGTEGSVQDAFNIYVIDRENHRIGIARIGSNMSYELVDRKAMWVSYL